MTRPEHLGRQVVALAIGLAGGYGAFLIGMPLPFMLGSMLVVTLAAMGRAPIFPPIRLRMLMVPILGVMLGSGFRPDVFDHFGDWLTTLLVLPVFVVAAFGAAFLFYWRIGRYDTVTAFYASAPGGLNDMMMMGAEAGGDERRIALAHASRVFIVVTLVVFFYTYVLDVSANGTARPYIGFGAVPPQELALLGAAAVIGTLIGPRLNLPAPQILGPMLLSAIIHLTGLSHSAPPTAAVNAAQVVMGTVIGCRFAGATPRDILKDLALALGAATAMLMVALVTAIAVAAMTGIAPHEVFLAFSPGGLPEMSLLALSLHADIAYVATMHIIRIAMVIALAPVVFRILKGRAGR